MKYLIMRMNDWRNGIIGRSNSPSASSASRSAHLAHATSPDAKDPDDVLPTLPEYRRDVLIGSCAHLLRAFLFLRSRHPAVLLCPSVIRQAFEATLALVTYAEDGKLIEGNEMILHSACTVFEDMQARAVPGIVGLPVHLLAKQLKRSLEVIAIDPA